MSSSGTYTFALSLDPATWPELPEGRVLYRIQHRVSGHCYIGMTTRGLRWRLRMHKGKLIEGRDLPIYRAFRKHGVDAFDVYVLATSSNVEELRQLEREAIARENPQYNCTGGGEGTFGYRHPPELLARIAKKNTGRPCPWKGQKRPAYISEKIKLAVRGKAARYWLGKKRDPETNAKISATKLAQSAARLLEVTRGF